MQRRGKVECCGRLCHEDIKMREKRRYEPPATTALTTTTAQCVHLRTQPLDVDLLDVPAVYRHAPLGGLVEPQQQSHAGRLAPPRGTDQGHSLTGSHVQAEALRVFLGPVDLRWQGQAPKVVLQIQTTPRQVARIRAGT